MAEDSKFVVHGSQVQKWTDDIQQLKQERDAYKKQRDELINDMQNVKRKAEAFDEMVKIYNQKNDLPSDEIFMEMGYCISDLEREE